MPHFTSRRRTSLVIVNWVLISSAFQKVCLSELLQAPASFQSQARFGMADTNWQCPRHAQTFSMVGNYDMGEGLWCVRDTGLALKFVCNMWYVLGDIVHVSAFGQHMITINCVESALDPDQSSNYSNWWPTSMQTLLHKVLCGSGGLQLRLTDYYLQVGMDWNLTLVSYIATWRAQRRLFSQPFNQTAVKGHIHTFAAHASARQFTLLESILRRL